jgi:hypothetical protein
MLWLTNGVKKGCSMKKEYDPLASAKEILSKHGIKVTNTYKKGEVIKRHRTCNNCCREFYSHTWTCPYCGYNSYCGSTLNYEHIKSTNQSEIFLNQERG